MRGTVTERASGQPITGALVTLEPAGMRAATVAVLANQRGEYAVRAPAAGRYRLTAKRIGVARFVSEAFDLAPGETRQIDVALEAVVYVLPEVRVVDGDMCVPEESDRARVAALWDEAQTVLTAAQISLRDRLFEGQVTRYVRGLHPRSLRILEESYGERRGIMDRPFVSLGGDSLSRLGYRRTVGDYEYYYAPDAHVLLSSAFRRDHCYNVVEGGRARRGLVGLAFEPGPKKTLPDVRGTMWLDARSFELRLVEFRYTLLPEFDGADHVGGEVHFGKLTNGAWLTSRWFLRFPQFGRSAGPVDAESRVPSVQVRPMMHRLVEEGGMVFTTGLRLFVRPATLTGVVLDSAGKPFAGATVRLSGTPFASESGANGRFRIDSLPGSRLSLVVEHPAYVNLASHVAEEIVELREGEATNLTIRAPRTRDIVERLCEGKLPRDDNGTLRVMVVDSASARPIPSMRVWLRWTARYLGSSEQIEALRPGDVGGTDGITDAAGAVTFCDLPPDVRLVFSALRTDGKPVNDSTALRIAKRELKVTTVTTRRP